MQSPGKNRPLGQLQRPGELRSHGAILVAPWRWRGREEAKLYGNAKVGNIAAKMSAFRAHRGDLRRLSYSQRVDCGARAGDSFMRLVLNG